jgi:L-asparaginase
MVPVVLVTCGGTVTMQTGPDGLRRPSGPGPVVQAVQHLAGAPIPSYSACEIDSGQSTPETWGHILSTVRRVHSQHPGVPVLVSHGTDTLGWTAGMLAAAGGWDVPVVLTASAIPLGDPYSDAETNLAGALAVAQHADPGVYVSFSGSRGQSSRVFQGGYVRKTGMSPQLFSAVGHPLGEARGGFFIQQHEPRQIPVQLRSDNFDSQVLLVRSNPAVNAQFYVHACELHPPAAVVIETYVCGTAPDDMVLLTSKLVGLGIPVLACPPVPLGQAQYPHIEALREAGAQVRLDATVELLVPYAASGGGR